MDEVTAAKNAVVHEKRHGPTSNMTPFWAKEE
jgi:hypothetical protein